MCRLFGLHAGPVARPATFWLIDAPDSLSAQSHRNPDGAGIGVFTPGGEVRVDKQPIAAWLDPKFAAAAHKRRGTTFLAHVRYASTGAHTLANTHPFLQDGRLFAHNGVVEGLPRLDAELAEVGATGLVRGQTDSERVFALITAQIRLHDGDVTGGLIAAITWISEHLPVYALNVVLTTSTDLWALRYPATNELYVLARSGGAAAEFDASSDRIHVRSADLTGRPSVIVASEKMNTDPAWRLLDPGELLHVSAGLELSSSRPFPTRPRQLLTRADLSGDAAASQEPAAG